MKAGDFVIRSTKQEQKVILEHSKRAFENPSNRTFPPNGINWQNTKYRKKKKEQFKRDVDLVVRYERRKKIQILLADLGPTYLENLRIECTPYLKVA